MSNWQHAVSFCFFALAWAVEMFTDKSPLGLALVGCMWLVLGLKECEH